MVSRKLPHGHDKLIKNSLVIGILSFLWLLLRSGTKPSRIVYPCQRAAASYTLSCIGVSAFPIFAIATNRIELFKKKKKAITLATLLCLLFVFWSVNCLTNSNSNNSSGGNNLIEENKLINDNIVNNPISNIFVIQNTTGDDEGVDKLIELMDRNGLSFYKTDNSPNGIISHDDVILIKVNSQWDQRGGTNTDLVKSLIQKITEHPDGFNGEIIVCDNGQDQFGSGMTGGSLDWKYNNAEDKSQSMQKVVDKFSSKYKVSTFLWDDITEKKVKEYSSDDYNDGYIVYDYRDKTTGIIVSYPKFKTKYGTYISFKYGVWNQDKKEYNNEKLKVINVPVLKTHGIYGVTGSVKHYMGVVSDKLTGHTAHNSVGNGGMGVQIAETRAPTINILDAIWVNAIPRGGPSTSYNKATETKIIALSTDPIALDYWSAEYILIPKSKSIGYSDVKSIDPNSNDSGSFGYWLLLSKEALNKSGFNYTMDMDQINVYSEYLN